MKKMRLFPKIFFYTLGIISVIIFVSHVLLYFFMPGVYVNQKNESLSALSEEAAQEMQGKSLDEVIQTAQKLSADYDANITLRIDDMTYIFSSNMTINTNSESIVSQEDFSSETKASEEPLYIDKVQGITLDDELRLSTSISTIDNGYFQEKATIITKENSFTLDDDAKVNAIYTMNLQPVEEASKVMILILPYTITISILLSIIAAYFFTKAITRPIQSICSSTKAMEKLEEDAKCEITSQDEIGELAHDINELYQTLQQTIHSLENEIENVSKAEKMKVDFLRSASHELKTPLTSMSVILENMILNVGKYKDRDVYLKKCKEIVDQLSMMIKNILDTSVNYEEANPQMKEDIKLDTWVQEVSESYMLLAKAKKIKVELQLESAITIQYNKNLLEKVFSNILANAIQNTSINHTIIIKLNDYQLSIYNECVPIAEEHLPHLKEAFYRPDFSRTKQTGGNGLGLYFVDQILGMMHTPYSFLPYENGMLFTIDFKEA